MKKPQTKKQQTKKQQTKKQQTKTKNTKNYKKIPDPDRQTSNTTELLESEEIAHLTSAEPDTLLEYQERSNTRRERATQSLLGPRKIEHQEKKRATQSLRISVKQKS